MAEPRKITIKLRPVGAKPAGVAKPAAPTESAASTSASTPAATASEPPGAPATEIPSAPEQPFAQGNAESPTAAEPPKAAQAKRQTTRVELPPEVAHPAPTPTAASAKPTIVLKKVGEPTPTPTPAEQAKRQTSRIELPREITQQPMSTGGDATVRLKPISQTAAPAPEDNAQAAKSKTARIALDSVLGGIQANTPLANTTQKTIKLKRSVPSPAAKPTASAPMTPVTGNVGEEKTIKLKRPAPLSLKKDAPKPTGEPELEPLESLDELEELAPLPSAPVAESTGSKAFTIVGIVAAALSIIATIVLCVVLQKQAASPDGSPATGNTLHSLPFQSF